MQVMKIGIRELEPMIKFQTAGPIYLQWKIDGYWMAVKRNNNLYTLKTKNADISHCVYNISDLPNADKEVFGELFATYEAANGFKHPRAAVTSAIANCSTQLNFLAWDVKIEGATYQEKMTYFKDNKIKYVPTRKIKDRGAVVNEVMMMLEHVKNRTNFCANIPCDGVVIRDEYNVFAVKPAPTLYKTHVKGYEYNEKTKRTIMLVEPVSTECGIVKRVVVPGYIVEDYPVGRSVEIGVKGRAVPVFIG